MANAVGAGKGGKAADKVGPSDTINFTYSLAVETALEDLQKEEELQATRSRRLNVKKKGMKAHHHATPKTEKPREKVKITKLDEIYTDWCMLKELATPRTLPDDDVTSGEFTSRREEQIDRNEENKYRKDRKDERNTVEEKRKKERDKDSDQTCRSNAPKIQDA